MAPPAGRRLPDDLIPDILVRLAPDDPTSVVRSSAVCKAWRRILADPTFAGRYRALHPTAPVHGFLHNHSQSHVSRLVPTTTSTFPATEHHMHYVHDCRHGRVLFYDYDYDYDRRPPSTEAGFVVWDPINGFDQLHRFGSGLGDTWAQQAVLCADGVGCDHRGCAGGPFIVAAVAMGFGGDDENLGKSSIARADFYSSETGGWRMHIYTDIGTPFDLRAVPAALVGDSLYFVGDAGILLRYRYDLLRRRLDQNDLLYRRLGHLCGRDSGYISICDSDYLSVIKPPEGKRLRNVWVLAADDGGLGLASLYTNSTRLHLWAREASGPVVEDAGQWVLRRVVDLKTMLPIRNPMRKPILRGVAEDGSFVFVSTEDGVFTVGLGPSLVARKVSEVVNVDALLHPFMSFYTESLLLKLASGKNAAPVVTGH